MFDYHVRGSEKLGKLGQRLREAGRKELRQELIRGLNRATKPLKEDAKREAEAILPRRGGLNRRVARSRLTTRTRVSGRNPSVRIMSKTGQRIDRGQVRKPVFGNRTVWVTQRVQPGWFTRPMERDEHWVRPELEQAMRNVDKALSRNI